MGRADIDRRRLRLGLVGTASALIGAAVAVPLLGKNSFRNLVTREVALLVDAAALSVGPEQLRARQDALPPPIRRHLQYAIGAGAPALRTARLRHDGTFRTSPTTGWWDIEGEQYFTAARPGFVWSARVRPARLFWIEARDALLHERGSMLVKAFSAVPVVNASGTEIDQGATLRWLAESPWFPYALVSDCIQWEPVDDVSARATVRYEGPPASAVFEVDEEGKLVRLRAQRYRDVGGGSAALTPWGGEYREYREFDGFRVPTSVEVGWDLGTGGATEGWFSYARFRIRTIDYNAAARF